MRPTSIIDIAKIIDGNLLGPIQNLKIENVVTHSKRMKSNSAFFAFAGNNTNGNNYVQESFDNGSLVAIVKAESEYSAPNNASIIEVEDPMTALRSLAEWCRNQISDNQKVICIVGDKGKSTTKDCLTQLLVSDSSVYSSQTGHNSQLGMALAMIDCPDNVDYSIFELGFSEKFEIEKAAQFLKPNMVVSTGIGSKQIINFSTEDQIQESLSLSTTQEAEMLITNSKDTKYINGLQSLSIPIHLVGNSDLPLKCKILESDPVKTSLEIIFPDSNHVVNLPTTSEDVIDDIILATTSAYKCGLSKKQIIEVLNSYRPINLELQVWKSPNNVTVLRAPTVIDSFALTDQFRYAKTLQGLGKLFLVVDEVNSASKAELHKFVEVIADEQPDKIYSLESQALINLEDLPEIEVSSFKSSQELKTQLLLDLEPGDTCLILSQSDKQLFDLNNSIIEALAPNYLKVNLSAIEHNFLAFRKLVGANVKITGMVKALAYGTDAIIVGKTLEKVGADFLGVSNIDEGANLRRSGVKIPILAMLGTAEEVPKIFRYRVTPVIYSETILDAIESEANNRTGRTKVHLEVNTGFNRSGFQPIEAKRAIDRILLNPNLELAGIMNHFAFADVVERDDYTLKQINNFLEVTAYAESLGMSFIRHASNTAATARFPEAHFDMVRIGIGLYGIHPCSATNELVKLQPVSSLFSRVIQIIDVPSGESVGYGGTFVASENGARIAVVPTGYFDGITRLMSNRGNVIIANQLCPISGNVSMDSMTVDITGCKDIEIGSPVLIFGENNSQEISFDDAAEHVNSISWEIISRIGPRVQRIFTSH